MQNGMDEETHKKLIYSLTISGYHCKTKQDLQAEYTRMFMLCGGIYNKLNFIRVGGIPLSPITLQVFTGTEIKEPTFQEFSRNPERFMPKFDKAPEEYSFALAIVESKPVFEGDVLFITPNALVYEAGTKGHDSPPPRPRLSPNKLKGRNEVTILIDSISHELHVRFDEISYLKRSLLGGAYQKSSIPITGLVSESGLTWKQWKKPEVYEEPHIIEETVNASKELGRELIDLAKFSIGFLIVGGLLIFGIPAILRFLRLLLS